jgi:trimeric autotransporter adhesin
VFHQGNVIRRAVWAGSTLVLAVSGLFAGMSGASAATLTGPVIPANANPSFASTPVSYSCTLSGVTTSTPVTLSATLSAPTSGMAGTAAAVTLTTQVMTLPAADSTQLPSLTRVTAAGTAASTGMSASTVPLTGMTTMPAGMATSIPAITITGSAIPSAAGTASIMAPAALKVTLVAGTMLTAFNCTRTTTTATSVQITVTAATVATATTGPMYACTVTVAGHTMRQMDQVPMTLSTSGPNTVGSTDMVTLSSPANGLGGTYPAGTSAVSFSGALPLAGAQSGSIPVSGAMANLTGGMFVVRTSLPLMAAGLLHIMPPSRFTVIVHVQQAVAIVAVCVLQTTVTTTMPASTMVNVTGAAMPAATMPAGTTTGTGTTPTTGTMPMGSANTGAGGSLHTANILPELAAGIAVLLAGAGLTIIGLRRRRRHTSA